MLKNPRVRLGLLMLLVCVVAWGVKELVHKKQRESAQRPVGRKQVKVFVAATDIAPHTILAPDLIRLEMMPEYEAGAFLTAQMNLDEIKGYVTRGAIRQDMPIQKALIAGRIEQLGLSYLIPPGRRAIIMDLKKEPNFYEMIKTNDRVDIVATYPSGDDPKFTRTIVRDALVLAVNTEVKGFSVAQRGPSAPPPPAQPGSKPVIALPQSPPQQQAPPPPPSRNITLAVTPRDAMAIGVSNKAMLDIILHPQREAGVLIEETGEVPPAQIPSSTATGGRQGALSAGKLAEVSGISLYDLAPPLKPKAEKPPAVTKAQVPPPPVPPLPLPGPPVVETKQPSPRAVHAVSSDTFAVQVFAGNSCRIVEVRKPS